MKRLIGNARIIAIAVEARVPRMLLAAPKSSGDRVPCVGYEEAESETMQRQPAVPDELDHDAYHNQHENGCTGGSDQSKYGISLAVDFVFLWAHSFLSVSLCPEIEGDRGSLDFMLSDAYFQTGLPPDFMSDFHVVLTRSTTFFGIGI